MLDTLQKIAQLLRIKHRLRDCIFGSGFDLPFKAPQLFFHVHGAGIHTNTD